MRVYALVGSSGTGKSYRAMEVAKDYKIEMIIDDGLLILGTKIVAGSSAKKEKTKIAAIKRALFTLESHIADAKRALNEYRPQSILILGTSRGMVKKIQEVLELPPIEKIINIQEISKEWEVERAKEIRRKEGKHVIPVPTLEVKKQFSGYFLDPLKIFRRNPQNRRDEIQEKTVVRPTFSYLGKYTIADTVIVSVVQYITSQFKGIKRVGRIHVSSNPQGLFIELDVTLLYGYVIPELLQQVQKGISKELDHMTGQNILGIDIYVKGLWV